MKKITSKTIIFILIIVFVKIFEEIFGIRNSQVGITVIIATLVLIQENLMKNPVKNLIKLISANLILGIFAHISSYSTGVGLVFNFIALSSIGYLLSFNLNKTLIVPFGLQYLFMLYNPVSGSDFVKRLLELAVGAVLIMAVQFVIYRKHKNIKSQENELIELHEDKEMYKQIKILGTLHKIHAIRGSYAIKIGLLTAITAFTVSFLNLQQGRWIVYTVFSLTELYSENCILRSKQRLQGTIVGVLIILILFTFIKSNAIRSLMVLVGGYLDGYTTNYRDKIICVTMSVMASNSLINGTLITAIERISYVVIGIILALIIDKLVLRKKLEDLTMCS